MSAPRDPALEYLGKAESVSIEYAGAHPVTDEAELLRGCLYALVAIGRMIYDAGSDE